MNADEQRKIAAAKAKRQTVSEFIRGMLSAVLEA